MVGSGLSRRSRLMSWVVLGHLLPVCYQRLKGSICPGHRSLRAGALGTVLTSDSSPQLAVSAVGTKGTAAGKAAV
jgi:hypothetical protein